MILTVAFIYKKDELLKVLVANMQIDINEASLVTKSFKFFVKLLEIISKFKLDITALKKFHE